MPAVKEALLSRARSFRVLDSEEQANRLSYDDRACKVELPPSGEICDEDFRFYHVDFSCVAAGVSDSGDLAPGGVPLPSFSKARSNNRRMYLDLATSPLRLSIVSSRSNGMLMPISLVLIVL